MLVGEQFGFTDPFSGSNGWLARYGDQEVSQFRSAEMIAEKWDISREDMEEFALESHRRAIQAIDEGRFDTEIVPLGEATVDEGPRREPDIEKMKSLQTLREGGRSPPRWRARSPTPPRRCSIASEQAVKDHGLKPRARIHHLSRARRRPDLDAHRARSRPRAHALEKTGHDASTTSTWSRSTRRSPRSCWRG